MNFSLPISPCRSLDLKSYFSACSEAGFSHLNLDEEIPHCSYRDRTGRLQLISEARSAVLAYDALHLPVTQEYDITCTDAETRMGAVVRIALLMSAARDIGCRAVILTITHALPNQYGSDARSAIHALEGLVETAEIMGIKLAVRNLIESRSLKTLELVFSEYRSPQFGLCYSPALDLLARGETCEILKRHSSRLAAATLSDTDGKSLTDLTPFTGEVDWQMVCSILSVEQVSFPLFLNIGYHGLSDITEYLGLAADAADRFDELLALG